MRGHINGNPIDGEKLVVFEVWGNMSRHDVPDEVVDVLDGNAPHWDEEYLEESMYVYIVGDESWVSETSVHELKLED